MLDRSKREDELGRRTTDQGSWLGLCTQWRVDIDDCHHVASYPDTNVKQSGGGHAISRADHHLAADAPEVVDVVKSQRHLISIDDRLHESEICPGRGKPSLLGPRLDGDVQASSSGFRPVSEALGSQTPKRQVC